MRPEALPDLAENELPPQRQPQGISGSPATHMLPLPSVTGSSEQRTDDPGTLRQSVFHAATNALEKRWHVQEVVRRGETDLLSKTSEIGRQGHHAVARQEGKQGHP